MRQHKIDLNQKIAARDWAGAVAQVDAAKDGEYGENNAVLFWLDKAAVLHHAGKFQESDAFLDLAEQRMDELYTQSVSKGVATFLVNDNADSYAGQVHERTLLHVLRALNHAYLGQRDGATVEARKVTSFLTELNDRLGDKRLAYRDDAFAQYLSGLLFEDQGKSDDARICFESANAAYGWYATEFGVQAPQLELGAASPDEGELVFLHYNGPAPRRETSTIQVAWNDAMVVLHASEEAEQNTEVKNALVAGISGNAITVALPMFVQDPFTVQGSEIEVGAARARTFLVEDVTAIAKSTLDASLPAIQAKAVVRATVKFLIAKVAEEETKRQFGSGWGMLAGLVARGAAAATETADTRGWSTLPAQFRMARLRLPVGTHSVKVRYFAVDGTAVSEELLDGVEIKSGQRTYVHVRTAI
jgi:hypothetical protein